MNLLKSLVLTLLTVTTAVSTYAQPAGYADQQSNSTAGLCLLCNVDNPNNAVDGDEDTFSQLNVPLGLLQASIQQTLSFPFVGEVGDEVAVVMGVTDVLDVNVLSNIKISTFLGTVQNADETQIDLGSIGVDVDDPAKFTFRFNAQFQFDAVQVKLDAPAAGLSENIKIYAAYDQNVADDSTAFIPACVLPDSQISGIEGTCVQILGLGCIVNNAPAAIDGDDGTFSELLVQLVALNAGPFQTFMLDNPACGVDSVNLFISGNDGAGGVSNLVNLNINPSLPGEDDGAIEVAAVDVNGNVIPGSEQFVETTTINLIDAGNLRYEYTYVPDAGIQEYYGVRVWYHGITLISGLNIHEVCVNRFQPPAPTGSNVVEFCFNTIGSLTVTPSPNTVAYWHATNNPGDLENDALFIGSTFDPSANNPGFTFTKDTTFYIFGRNIDKDCFSLEYDSIFVSVYNELPDPIQLDIETCYGSTVDLFPQVFGPIYNMYSDAAGTDLILGNAQAFRVGPILSDTTFYVQTTNEAGCVSANIIPINVNLKEELFFADVDSVINACIGEDVTVTITNPVGGVTYNWYTAPLEGTQLFTGTEYTFNLTADTDLYIDAVAISGGCDSSAFRKHVDINAVAKPTLTVADTFLLVCPGDSVQAIAQSSAGDVVWYDAATGGNELFRGNAITIYDNGGTQVVYAEATNDRCAGAERQAYTITSTTDILVQLGDLSTAICDGADVTINAPNIANVTFTFWDAPLAGNQIGTGSSITILNLTQDTTFYVQIDQANCTNAINNRTEVNLTVTTPPTFDVVADVVYGCLDDSLSFEIDNPNAAFTYNWYDDQGALVFTGEVFDFKLTADTMNFFAEVAEGLCPNPNLIELTAYRAEDQLNPIVNGGNPILICVGDGVDITATSNITTGASYMWFTDSVGGTLIDSDNNLQLNGPINADVSYWVQVQYQNICGSGLSERVEAFVDVRSVLAAPVVSCGASGTDFVTFNFNNLPGTADNFIVNVNNGPDVVLPANQFNYVVNGLDPDETVEIKVRRTGTLACEESGETSFTCTSKACAFDVVEPQFKSSQEYICAGETFTISLKSNTIPNGDYAVTFTNTRNGLVDNLQNISNFVITEDNGTARSYTAPSTNVSASYVYNARFEMLNQPGCETQIVELNFELVVSPNPEVRFVAVATTPSVVGQFINEYTFNNLTSNVSIEDWDFGDGTFLHRNYDSTIYVTPPSNVYAEEGTYVVTLQVTNEFGCVGTGVIDKPITVSTIPEIFIPNTFSPNGDNNNDEFKVFGENIKLVSLKVFNNYGNELYRSGDLAEGWDGTYEGEDQPSGVYAYTAVIEDFLGIKYNREGTVTLIRK